MMALEWLKTILGDAYTPESGTAAAQGIGRGFVSRTDFSTRAAGLETRAGQLEGQAKTRAAQLAARLLPIPRMPAENRPKAGGTERKLRKRLWEVFRV